MPRNTCLLLFHRAVCDKTWNCQYSLREHHVLAYHSYSAGWPSWTKRVFVYMEVSISIQGLNKFLKFVLTKFEMVIVLSLFLIFWAILSLDVLVKKRILSWKTAFKFPILLTELFHCHELKKRSYNFIKNLLTWWIVVTEEEVEFYFQLAVLHDIGLEVNADKKLFKSLLNI